MVKRWFAELRNTPKSTVVNGLEFLAGLALVSYEELQRAADRDHAAPAAEQQEEEPKAKPKASRSRRRRASVSPSPAAPGPSMRRRRATKTPVKFDPDAPTDATYY